MALNALVDSFLPQSKKCGTERVKAENMNFERLFITVHVDSRKVLSTKWKSTGKKYLKCE